MQNAEKVDFNHRDALKKTRSRSHRITSFFQDLCRTSIREKSDGISCNNKTQYIETTKSDMLPNPMKVRGSDIARSLYKRQHKPDVELALRRLYWRQMNDPHRSAIRSISASQPVAFCPSALQIENMRRIKEILCSGEYPVSIELTELHRELGEFEEAERNLSHVPEGFETEAKLQSRLLIERSQAPALIRW